MKIARVRLPGQQGPTIGLVDEASSEILDAGQVIQQLGLAVDASTAVELVRHNTEHAGALSDAVKDLSQFSITRWPVDSLRFLCPHRGGLPQGLPRLRGAPQQRPQAQQHGNPAQRGTTFRSTTRGTTAPWAAMTSLSTGPVSASRWTTSWNWPASSAKRASTYPWSTPTSTSAATAS